MKKQILLSVACFAFIAAQAQSSVPEVFAMQMAKRIQDSLGLNDQSMQKIYDVNIGLHVRKMEAWQQGERDSISLALQRIENTRDSLYFPILGDQKFILYREKKNRVIH